MSKRFKRCVLHIGTEKTGTTTIQDFLHINRKALATDGVLYPSVVGLFGSQYGFACIAMDAPWESDLGIYTAITDAESQASYRADVSARLEKEFASQPKCDTLLVSSEHFHSRLRTPAEIARLRDFLAPHVEDFEVIIYFRRQDRVAPSIYSTMVKGGATAPFTFPGLAEGTLDYYFDYEHIHDNWAGVFGETSLVVRIFDKSRFTNGKLLDDFCQACGLDQAGKTEPAVANESLTRDGLEIMREINRQIPRIVNRQVNPLHQQVAKVVAEHCSGKAILASREQARAFLALYQAGNTRLQARVMPEGMPLFDDSFEDYPEQIPTTPPAFRDTMQVMSLVIDRIGQTASWDDVPAPVAERKWFCIRKLTLLFAGNNIGKPREYGDPVTLDLDFRLDKAVAALTIELSLYDEQGRNAFIGNSTAAGFSLQPVAGVNHARVTVPANLPAGRYVVDAALYDNDTNPPVLLANFVRLFSFRVVPKRDYPSTGYVHLPLAVSLDASSANIFAPIEDARGTISAEHLPASLTVGQSIERQVTLHNDSAQHWASAVGRPLRLSYRWLDASGMVVVPEGEKSPIRVRDIPPAGALATNLKILAPAQPGQYQLQVLPLQEKVGWLDEKGFTPLVVPMQVDPVAGDA